MNLNEGREGKQRFDRHLENGRDPEGQNKAGAVFAPLEVPNGLVVHANVISQFLSTQSTKFADAGELAEDLFAYLRLRSSSHGS